MKKVILTLLTFFIGISCVDAQYINYKDDSKKAIEWLKELGNPYSNIAVDKKGKIAIDWGVYGIPETYIVNSKGIIKYRHVGPVTEKIYKKISLLIKEIK